MVVDDRVSLAWRISSEEAHARRTTVMIATAGSGDTEASAPEQNVQNISAELDRPKVIMGP